VNKTEVFRAELKEGYSLEHIAKKHGVSTSTVKRHAAFELANKKILLGTEVHIDGERGRWEFRGGVGHTKDGEQFAEFINSRTGRSRTFHTRRITTVHQPKVRNL